MQRMLVAFLIAATRRPAQKPCEALQFRFEREGAPPTSRHFVRPDTNLRVALNYAAIVDGRDIVTLTLEPAYGDTARRDIDATLTPRGAATLAKATRSHVGRHIGVTLGDELIFYAVIASATGKQTIIAMSVDRARARALLARAERARSCAP